MARADTDTARLSDAIVGRAPTRPSRGYFAEPALEHELNWGGIEIVQLPPTDAANGDQVGGLKHAQVLHDAEARHVRQRRIQLAERLSVPLEEAIQQEPSVAIAKRFEDELHASPR
jgi:hypothetical protein